MASYQKVSIPLFVFAFFLLLGSSPASAQKTMPENAQTVMPGNKVPGQVESTARRLMNQLSHRGYEVLRGYFKVYTTDDCDLSYSVMHTCYANNPAAPHVLPVLPAWPDDPGPVEWVDPATVGAFGHTANGWIRFRTKVANSATGSTCDSTLMV